MCEGRAARTCAAVSGLREFNTALLIKRERAEEPRALLLARHAQLRQRARGWARRRLAPIVRDGGGGGGGNIRGGSSIGASVQTLRRRGQPRGYDSLVEEASPPKRW